MDDPLPQEEALSYKDLKKFFHNSINLKKKKLIGIEAEKIGLNSKTGKSAKYTGKNGYLAILGKIYEELGWKITKQEGKFILQMERCGASLNLESDGRIELAGSTHESIHDLAREFRIHQNEITEISKACGVDWLGIGYHPVSKNQDIEDLPVERKDQIVNYLKDIKERSRNDFGLAWYKKTAGIHVNIDYFSEYDFALKAKTFYRLVPILIAIFANSPFSKKEFTGFMSYRYHVTLNTGIERFRIDKKLYESEFSFDDWLEHVLSLPVLFLKKGENWINPQMSFAAFMERGYRGHIATQSDYEMHTKSLWKDIKLKNVIELRCFDSLPPSLVPAVAALIKGLAYDSEALNAARELTKNWSFVDYQSLQEDAAKYGLQASYQGTKLLEFAKELISIAESALKKERIVDAYGHDESKFLEPIKEYIFVKEKSPAEWLVQQWEGEWRNNFYPVFEWAQY